MLLKMNPKLFLIEQVSFGFEHTLALTVDGKLFWWGYSDEEAIGKLPIIWEPHLVEELRDIEVIDIACSTDHSLILCRDGALLSCGKNWNGQLGRDGEESEFLPVEMRFKPVTILWQYASLMNQMVLMCGQQGLLLGGWNRHYELGRPKFDELPDFVDGLDGEIPVSV